MADNRPVRLQSRRVKGFDLQTLSLATNGLPAVLCTRPGIFGNPFIAGQPSGYQFKDGGDPKPLIPSLSLDQCISFFENMAHGMLQPEMHPHGHDWMKEFRKRIGGHPTEYIRGFRGKNMACFCNLPPPGEIDMCHARILLEIANAPTCEAAP